MTLVASVFTSACLVWLLMAVALCTLMFGCGSPIPRPSLPDPSLIVPLKTPAATATPADKEAYYKSEVDRLSMTLAQAKIGLTVARHDAAEAELKTWQTWTRWIGLIGVTVAIALGGTLSWLISPRVGIPVAAILAGTALAVLGFGAALRWLPAALGVVSFGGLGAWAFYHHRARQALAATARMGDAIEARALAGVAKLSAQTAQELAGLHRYVQRARGKSGERT